MGLVAAIYLTLSSCRPLPPARDNEPHMLATSATLEDLDAVAHLPTPLSQIMYEAAVLPAMTTISNAQITDLSRGGAGSHSYRRRMSMKAIRLKYKRHTQSLCR